MNKFLAAGALWLVDVVLAVVFLSAATAALRLAARTRAWSDSQRGVARSVALTCSSGHGAQNVACLIACVAEYERAWAALHWRQRLPPDSCGRGACARALTREAGTGTTVFPSTACAGTGAVLPPKARPTGVTRGVTGAVSSAAWHSRCQRILASSPCNRSLQTAQLQSLKL